MVKVRQLAESMIGNDQVARPGSHFSRGRLAWSGFVDRVF